MTDPLTREKLETLEIKLDSILAIIEGKFQLEYLTVSETSDLLRCSVSLIRDRLRLGKLPFQRLGDSETSLILIRRSDVMEMLK